MDSQRFIAGGLSGIIEVLATHPIDYIKIKKQEYKQLGKEFNLPKIKLNKLYTGLMPRLIGVAPMRVVFWGSQDYYRNALLKMDNKYLNKYNFLIIGWNSAFLQTIIDTPIEIYKIGKMTNMTNENLKQSLINMQGFNANLIRNFGFTSVIAYLCFNNHNHNGFIDKFKYAAFGGLIGSVLTQPIDYVKTQQQRCQDNRSIYKIIQETIKDDYRKLYIGGFYRSVLSISTMGIGFVAFDFFNNLLKTDIN